MAELFENKMYEGHPALWYVILFGITRLTSNPSYMQSVHLVFAALAVLVFLVYSPFPRVHKALFVFGYFPFYEYAVLSRNYAIGLLLIFLFCALLGSSRKHYVVLSGLLFLLMQASLYGLLVGLTLAFYLVVVAYRRDSSAITMPVLIASGAILSIGVFVSVTTMKPPVDSGFAIPWDFTPSLREIGKTLTAIWRAYVPIPDPGLQFWNTNVLSGPFQLVGSLVLFSGALILLRSKLLVLLTFVLGTSGMLAFMQVKHFGYARHHGHLFVLLIACLWLGHSSEDFGRWPNQRSGQLEFGSRYASGFVAVLLVLQCLAGFYASGMDFRHTFSAGKDTAQFIRDNGLDQSLLVGFNPIQTVAGYLNKGYYNFANSRHENYSIFDTTWAAGSAKFRPELISVAEKLSKDMDKQVLFVLGDPIENLSAYPLKPVAEFHPAIQQSEEFYLYLLTK